MKLNCLLPHYSKVQYFDKAIEFKIWVMEDGDSAFEEEKKYIYIEKYLGIIKKSQELPFFSRSAENHFHHLDGARNVTTDFKCDALCR